MSSPENATGSYSVAHRVPLGHSELTHGCVSPTASFPCLLVSKSRTWLVVREHFMVIVAFGNVRTVAVVSVPVLSKMNPEVSTPSRWLACLTHLPPAVVEYCGSHAHGALAYCQCMYVHTLAIGKGP